MAQGSLLGLRRTDAQPAQAKGTGDKGGGTTETQTWQPLARDGKVIGKPSPREGF